jgi:hypothetical protein
MSHNPIHDFLDMAFSRISGDKKAYERYKRDKQREREAANTRRADGPSTGGPSIQVGMAGGPYPQRRAGGYLGGYPDRFGRPDPDALMYGSQPHLPPVATPRGQTPFQAQRRRAQTFAGLGNPPRPSPVMQRRGTLGHRGSNGSLNSHSSHGSHHPRNSFSDLIPAARRPQPGPAMPVAAPDNEAPRARTTQYRLGDMARTYLEGMVPTEEADRLAQQNRGPPRGTRGNR